MKYAWWLFKGLERYHAFPVDERVYDSYSGCGKVSPNIIKKRFAIDDVKGDALCMRHAEGLCQACVKAIERKERGDLKNEWRGNDESHYKGRV